MPGRTRTLNAATQTELITLLIVVLVISRFLVRELRARKAVLNRMWVRPAVLLALTALAIFGAFAVHGGPSPELLPSLAAGLILGAIVGYFVSASTVIEPTEQPGVVRLHGSWTTVAIWLGALAVRMAARYFLAAGALAQQTAINAGTILVVAVAFGVFALLIVRRAATLGSNESARVGRS